MKIIGHRGARGLVTENTLESFQKAVDLGVDAIEFDVWTTKDGVPVVHHDESLFRMTGDPHVVHDSTLAQIKELRTRDGKIIPTAEQVIQKFKNTQIVLEIKDRALTKGCLELLKKYSDRNMVVISFNHSVLIELKKIMPDLMIYPLSSRHPLRMIELARIHGFAGIDINAAVFNLFVYLQARKYGLDVMIYPGHLSRLSPANNYLYLRIMKLLGFDIGVATDFPSKIARLRQ